MEPQLLPPTCLATIGFSAGIALAPGTPGLLSPSQPLSRPLGPPRPWVLSSKPRPATQKGTEPLLCCCCSSSCPPSASRRRLPRSLTCCAETGGRWGVGPGCPNPWGLESRVCVMLCVTCCAETGGRRGVRASGLGVKGSAVAHDLKASGMSGLGVWGQGLRVEGPMRVEGPLCCAETGGR